MKILKVVNYIESLLNRGRFVFRKITPRQNVKLLIESLRPIKTQFDLIRLGSKGDVDVLVEAGNKLVFKNDHNSTASLSDKYLSPICT